MEKKFIFTFEASDNMILANDIVLPNGRLIAAAGTLLNSDIISRVINYKILEIAVYDNISIPDTPPENASSPSYFEKIRNSGEYKHFNSDYTKSVSSVKESLHSVAFGKDPIDADGLLANIAGLLSDSRNCLNLFDMLHSMRQFDDLTFIHCVNVSLICSVIGKWLNFSEEDCNILTLSGLLHDIGKLLIPNDILTKPGKLTDTEYDLIKNHVTLGFNKLKNQNIDQRIKDACLFHHERCDGTGYPFRFKSRRIPDFAKIVAIADVYDAMTAARVYRGSICPFEVIKIMEIDTFSKFDPKFLLPFLKNITSSYIHTNVKLSDGRIGEVILINQNSLANPVVKCGEDFVDLSMQHGLNIASLL